MSFQEISVVNKRKSNVKTPIAWSFDYRENSINYMYRLITCHCLFLVVWIFSSHSRFFTHYETSLLPVKGYRFWHMMLGTYGHWPMRFFSISCLLWQGTSVCNGHLRGPVTLTSIAESFALGLSLPFLRLRSVAAGIRTPSLPLAERTL